MSVTISRSDLLNAFEKLQSQFNHALSDAQAKDQEFEELRGRFRQNLERRLKEEKKYEVLLSNYQRRDLSMTLKPYETM